jgi:hypothetical protein
LTLYCCYWDSRKWSGTEENENISLRRKIPATYI